MRGASSATPEKSAILSDELRYDAADWERAEQRRTMISALSKLPERNSTHIQDAANALNVSPRYIWRLLRRLATRGDNATIFLPMRSDKRAPRLAASAEAIIQQAIKQHYAKSSRPSMQSLVREVTRRCKAASVAPPSYQARRRTRAETKPGLARPAARRFGQKSCASSPDRRPSRCGFPLGTGSDRQHALRHPPRQRGGPACHRPSKRDLCHRHLQPRDPGLLGFLAGRFDGDGRHLPGARLPAEARLARRP